MKACAQTWSNYTSTYTIKLLIVISPQGVVMYISVVKLKLESRCTIGEGCCGSIRE